MPGTEDQMLDIKIMSFTFAGVALIFTALRLYVRRKNYWWDDLCAGLACFALCGQTIVLAVTIFGALPPTGAIPTKVAVNYLNAIAFVLEDWLARLALLYSIIRITPGHGIQKVLHWMGLLFVICCLTNVFLFVGYCERHDEWKHFGPAPICIVPKPVPIYQIVTGITSDTILVILPLRTLKMLTSAPAMRRRLMIIFSASVLLTIACIVQAVITFRKPGMGTLMSALAEGFVAVIVCNLAIVSIAIMQLVGYNTTQDFAPEYRPKFTADIEFRTSFTDDDLTTSGQILDDSRFAPSRGETGSGTGTTKTTDASEVKESKDEKDAKPVAEGSDSDSSAAARSPTKSSLQKFVRSLTGGSSSDAVGAVRSTPERRPPRPVSPSVIPVRGATTMTFMDRWRSIDVDADIEEQVFRSGANRNQV